MTLPTEKTQPKSNLWEYPILLYGRPKIGKSTLCAEIPNNLFINTGGGLDALSVYKVDITDWEDFLKVGVEIISGKHNFGAITIDTIDRLHKLCQAFICKRQNIVHPQDLEFGKGWDMVKDEFIRPLTRLALSPYGLIMISHEKEIEISTRTKKVTKSVTTLQDHIWQMIDGLSAVIWFMDIEETIEGEKTNYKRVLRTKPSLDYIAGDRTGKFLSFGDIEIKKEGGNWERIEKIFKGELIEDKTKGVNGNGK